MRGFGSDSFKINLASLTVKQRTVNGKKIERIIGSTFHLFNVLSSRQQWPLSLKRRRPKILLLKAFDCCKIIFAGFQTNTL
ncbi:hypothetical protein BpHYR1_019600 [Brachionus plicatilis]|uniref:Uncharacterized protein n=1 Tax=Brachionus plicatilis TaxID=10195 RepID=A0A3M7S751_BRAPC|nr:hypothetical protein BpHYR1_019600 [Brachionus plicatilis]